MFDQLNQIELAPWIVDLLGYVVNFGIVALPLLIVAIVTFYGGEKAVGRFRLLLLAFRTAVDEPSDMLIKWYAKQTGQKPEDLSAEIVEQIDNILKNIPARESLPLAEREPGG